MQLVQALLLCLHFAQHSADFQCDWNVSRYMSNDIPERTRIPSRLDIEMQLESLHCMVSCKKLLSDINFLCTVKAQNQAIL